MKGPYFEPMDSMAAQTDGSAFAHVLEVMAQRYIGANPPHGPVYRVTRGTPIRKLSNHTYEFPIGRLFPGMEEGQLAYAWAKLWSEEAQEFIFQIRAYGPVKLYHNGEKCFGSSPEEEGPEAAAIKLKVNLVRGWNSFVLELGKNAKGGCGAEFGTGNRKNKPYHFLAPTLEREGEEGWIYTAPSEEALAGIPGCAVSESHTGRAWLPESGDSAWTLEKKAAGSAVGGSTSSCDLSLLYPGASMGTAAYAWTKLVNKTAVASRIVLAGTSKGPLELVWDGVKVYAAQEPGPFSVEVALSPEGGHLAVRSTSTKTGWGFTLQLQAGDAELTLPRLVHGCQGRWLHLGPFTAGAEVNITEFMSLDTLAQGMEGLCFWTTGKTGGHIRPFLENELFGRWNYPLGVTLFGLLEASSQLGRRDYAEYVARHVEFSTSTYEYSLWDRERFGAAGLNNQLSHVDSLDDCGSFGALAILAGRIRPLKGVRKASDDIARYIMEEQDRMEDGALYRKAGVSISMRNTMWCDDMYMSVPFLCRYAEMTGNPAYVDEAARQLLLYKNYLYMPELKIMSHVYNVSEGRPSGTAWGRGNGWVFFSLAVLLSVLPAEHKDRPAVLAFYRELAEGYRRLQGRNGLWHQVLVDHESYEESSCTSMFMYGFALGVRHGWLEQPERYAQAVLKGWQGLCARAIDSRGNLYGVCKGSSWSHSHSYYKHDLGWNLNDTHGIGIVLLAGIEAWRMKDFLLEQKA
jgi:unsaturated rhamnogalacturonyl hydrolase